MAALLDKIIKQILLNLPVKSLLRFSTVSSPWYQMIHAAEFAHEHHKMQSNDTRLNVFYGFDEPHIPWSSCPLAHLMYDEEINVRPITSDLRITSYDSIHVVGSCNGVICIATILGDVFLWNPAMRLYKVLASSGDKPLEDAAYGFGYDEEGEEYKVVKHMSTVMESDYGTLTKVYSSRTKSWRSIDYEDGPGEVYIEESGVFVNGAIHWIGFRINHTFVVISLNVVTETYEEMSQPDYGEVVECVRLGAWRGCLCIITSCNETEVNFWVMKEYGVGELWTKLVHIPNFHGLSQIVIPTLCFVMENGDMLLKCGASLVVYSSDDSSMRYLPRVSGQRETDEFVVTVYGESLMFPY
ncbi:hypothetical protein CDL12_11883 [Handroanthus impetiginosus]|uniref:F-box domain-containing protein n=1 Tax=Handroanthus impetiginosus TaxID=429701 RepID=A0A2G9HD61_9LAMI|nr:hypothetical protein CDL12_11883 [Handroanthus impetiginosus]